MMMTFVLISSEASDTKTTRNVTSGSLAWNCAAPTQNSKSQFLVHKHYIHIHSHCSWCIRESCLTLNDI